MNKILKVEETTFNSKLDPKQRCNLEGYIITTEKGPLLIGISHAQQCCESSGYFSSLDDIHSLVGQDLIQVELVDECYNKEILQNGFIEEASCIFINVVTNKQTVQFTVYNEHNGYYGHNVCVSYPNVLDENYWL